VAVAHGHSSSPDLVNELVGLGLYAAAGIGVAVIADRLASARADAVAAAADATRRAADLVVAREAADRLSRDAQRRARDFATLFEEAPIGLGVAEDVECRRITPNRAFSEMLGLGPGQNISQTAGPDERVPLQILHPDGTPIPPEELAVQRAARTGQAVRAVEVDVVRRDGTRLALLEFAAPLFDDHGQPRGAIGAFLDVTSSRRASEEQRFLAEATRLVNRSLDHEHTLSLQTSRSSTSSFQFQCGRPRCRPMRRTLVHRRTPAPPHHRQRPRCGRSP
jgi:PAS domain-containing protein